MSNVIFSLYIMIRQANVTADNVNGYSSDLVAATSNTDITNSDGVLAAVDALQKIVEIADPSEEVCVSFRFIWFGLISTLIIQVNTFVT